LATVQDRVEIVGLDGEPVWIGCGGRPIEVSLSFSPSQGRLIELFVATVRVPIPKMASESRMAELFMTSAAPMQSSDRDGRIEFVNDAWLELLGYKRDEVIGHHGREFMCDGAHWQQLIAQLQRGEQIQAIEIQARRKDGRILSLLLNSTVARDATGMAYTRTTLTDVTDFRATERTMRLEVHGNAAVAVAETLGVYHPKVLALLARAGDAEFIGVWLPSPDRGTLVAHTTWCAESGGFESFELATKVISFAPGVGLPGRVWQTEMPHIVSDLRYDSNYLRQREAVAAGLISGLAFPLSHEGKVLGVIDMYSRECVPNDASVVEALAKLGRLLGSIISASEHTTNNH
jgi:two-component system sensor histidine kinase/response regulator